MRIITNLIVLNQLKQHLKQVNIELENIDYEKSKTLWPLRFKPDEYAVEYERIDKVYQDALSRQKTLQQQIKQISGINIFKKVDIESLSK